MSGALVTDDAGLAALVPDWSALWRRVPGASPFQHPGWLMAWWRQFGSGRPRVAVLREDDALIGVLPCYLLAEGGGDKLLPIGVSLSDDHDALLDPAAPADAASRLLSAVLAASSATRCDLVELAPGAALRRAAVPPGWHVVERPGMACPVLSLPEGAALADALPIGQVRKLRRIGHRLGRLGGASSTLADAGSLEADLDTLFAWQRRRRTSLGTDGLSASGEAFLREAAAALLAAGLLRLVTLRIAGAAAAAFLAFRARPDRLLLYMSGFDEAYAAYSPGRVVLGALLEATLPEGVREVHFLRGDEAYKYDWGAVDRMNASRHLERLP